MDLPVGKEVGPGGNLHSGTGAVPESSEGVKTLQSPVVLRDQGWVTDKNISKPGSFRPDSQGC